MKFNRRTKVGEVGGSYHGGERELRDRGTA